MYVHQYSTYVRTYAMHTVAHKLAIVTYIAIIP